MKTMNEDFLQDAKRRARRLGQRLAPPMREALTHTRKQAEKSFEGAGGLLRAMARRIADDITKRP